MNDPQITVCWNNLSKASDDSLAQLLAHETTHRLQQCTAKDPADPSCEGSLQREIEARKCANQCNGFVDCLSKALASSCNPNKYCKNGADVSKLYAALQKWYQDKETKGAKTGGFCHFYDPPIPPNPQPRPSGDS